MTKVAGELEVMNEGKPPEADALKDLGPAPPGLESVPHQSSADTNMLLSSCIRRAATRKAADSETTYSLPPKIH